MRWLWAAVALVLLAACSGGRAADGPPRVRVSLNGVEGGKNTGDVKWLRAMETRIEAEVPVDVEILTDGGSDESYKARLILDLYGRTGPDIVSFDGFWTAGMASAGLLQPLDGWLADWPEWGSFFPSMQRMGQYDGKTYVIPFNTDVRGIYYRKDLFAQAGIPLPWKPASLDDLYAAGEKLKALPGVIPIQWNAGTSFGEATTMQGLYLPLLYEKGRLFDGQRWLVGGEPLRAALEFYRQVYVERGLGDVTLQLDPRGRDRSFELFRDGRIGIYPEGTYMWLGVLRPGQAWGMDDRDRKVGWAPMPGPVSISGGGGYILNPHSPRPDLSWEVLRRLASAESLRLRMEISPFVPPRKDLLDFPDDPVLQQQIEEALPVTTFRPGLPAYPRVSEAAQAATEAVVRGVPVAEALAGYRRAVTDLVGAERVTE